GIQYLTCELRTGVDLGGLEWVRQDGDLEVKVGVGILDSCEPPFELVHLAVDRLSWQEAAVDRKLTVVGDCVLLDTCAEDRRGARTAREEWVFPLLYL